MKNNNHDDTVPVEKTHYKKKYLLRKLQEAEAQAEIEEYDGDPSHCVACESGFCYLHSKA